MIQPNQPQHYACYTCNSSMILYRTIQRRAGEHDIKLWTCTHCIAAADTQSSAPRYANSKAKCEIIETINPSTRQKKYSSCWSVIRSHTASRE